MAVDGAGRASFTTEMRVVAEARLGASLRGIRRTRSCRRTRVVGIERRQLTSYYSLVKRASITDAKNQLSALIDRVRRGERIIIEDRGVPVARLDSMPNVAEDHQGRIARLERAGLARRADAPPPRSVLETPPPRPSGGARLSDAVLEERADGR